MPTSIHGMCVLTALMAFTFPALFRAAAENFHGGSIHGMRVNGTHSNHSGGTFHGTFRHSMTFWHLSWHDGGIDTRNGSECESIGNFSRGSSILDAWHLLSFLMDGMLGKI
jgi:hypothetical protein